MELQVSTRPRRLGLPVFSISYPFLTRYLPPVMIMAIVALRIVSLLSLVGFACASIANTANFKLSPTQLASSGCSAASVIS